MLSVHPRVCVRSGNVAGRTKEVETGLDRRHGEADSCAARSFARRVSSLDYCTVKEKLIEIEELKIAVQL